MLAAKQYVMQATAEYRQATVAKQQKKFGEEIARLQVSGSRNSYVHHHPPPRPLSLNTVFSDLHGTLFIR